MLERGELAAALAVIVRDAGDRALARWHGAGDAVRVWDKAPNNPVSDVDLALDALLYERLSALVPDAGWLSEESLDSAERLGRRRIWCVDPIDGTRDFIAGRPGWAVSVALVEDGKPVIGVVYAPAAGQFWAAEAGQGARCNDTPLTASQRAVFAGARVPADALPAVDRDLTLVAKPNSIALRITMVAADAADLVATLRWGFEWDVAAAALIAAEAGARVTDAFGAPLLFNTPRAQAFGVVVCAPAIHADAIARLAERAAEIAPRTRDN